MNGFDLSKKLKTLQACIKIAFITGNYLYIKKSNIPIIAPYIFKPFGKEDIENVIY